MHDKKILIINPFGIGDVIFSTPLIEVLKRAVPGSFIGYICNRRAGESMLANPNLDKIFIYEKDDYRDIWKHSKIGGIKKIASFLKEIKKYKFDISIDLSLGYHYSMFLKFIGIKKRIGLNYRNRGRFLTDKLDVEGFHSKHVIEHYLDLLNPLGVDVKKYDIKPKIYLTENESVWADNFLKNNGIGINDLLIGIIPGCGASWGQDAKFRRWDKGNFAKVADSLADRHKAKIILFGDSKEISICEDIRSKMKNDVVVSCGKTSLRESLGLLSRCRLIITNDGGPLHMAVGLGIKTVSIFGPVDEKVYGPYPPGPDHIVVSRKDVPCRPCYKKFKYSRCEDRKCLDTITSDEVLQAVDGLLKS